MGQACALPRQWVLHLAKVTGERVQARRADSPPPGRWVVPTAAVCSLHSQAQGDQPGDGQLEVALSRTRMEGEWEEGLMEVLKTSPVPPPPPEGQKPFVMEKEPKGRGGSQAGCRRRGEVPGGGGSRGPCAPPRTVHEVVCPLDPSICLCLPGPKCGVACHLAPCCLDPGPPAGGLLGRQRGSSRWAGHPGTESGSQFKCCLEAVRGFCVSTVCSALCRVCRDQRAWTFRWRRFWEMSAPSAEAEGSRQESQSLRGLEGERFARLASLPPGFPVAPSPGLPLKCRPLGGAFSSHGPSCTWF